MKADSMVAGNAAHQGLIDSLADALCGGALPGELKDFGREDCQAAAAFVAVSIGRRPAGTSIVRLESTGTRLGERRMRICIANDDMPFLVDSVAGAIAARGLIIHRLLHPVVCVDRDSKGALSRLEPLCDDLKRRESLMYIEVDRADAKGRTELVAELQRVLANVREAVTDWRAMQDNMRAQADAVADGEGRELLHWLAEGAMTLLGYEKEQPRKRPSDRLGIMKLTDDPTDEGGSEGAIRYFEQGGQVPLIAKADLRSPVHRRVPLDLIVVPLRQKDKITGIGVHAGLWTSEALTVPIEHVPVLRRLLDRLEKDFGFDPTGHSGKALRHAISSLPRDLLVNLRYEEVKELAATAISLADRPRPTLILVRSILKGHMFAFVWLPRDELTTRRRIAIGEMIETAAKGEITNWSVDLGDGDLALVRYTLNVDAKAATPDVGALDRRLDAMVRGWIPSVEEALGEMVGEARATRLAITYLDQFPEGYRIRTGAEDAASDVVCLARLEDPAQRAVRLFARDGESGDRLHLKTYRLGEIIPLSEAVPVFENFGFRVLDEVPTPVGRGGATGFVHDFDLQMPRGGNAAMVLKRAPLVERAIADVLEGKAENDPFNQLIVATGLEPREVTLFRAWFRYLRQTGLSYSQITVVEALRHAPDVTRGLIALFDAMHDPKQRGRAEATDAAERKVERGLSNVAAIDEDRILRLIRGVIRATLRTNAFSPAGAEALAFKLESALVPGLPAPVPWREIWVYSPRVEGIHLRGGPVARGGLRWSDRRDDFRTEVLGLMKAQVVKNAVIVPTGAKGGFYPKHLPNPAEDREAWFAEGTESYRIFIRSLLSVTDNIVDDKVVHPEGVVIHDDDDPYFVVAADKGTATFSDVANALSLERNFWLGDAFASGGSNGYDHKAMGITARGAWVAVQRHFLEMGIDVQSDPITVAGVGDMSGDVFGNGMLLSKAIRLVAAFDHRHIFIDPDPDPASSWEERKRMFDLPRSSWDDYDRSKLSKGGGIYPRTQKSIELSAEARKELGIETGVVDPATLMNAILKAPVDLLWFGGIGTYVKASTQANVDVGDPANDAIRVDAIELRTRAIGEGANLGITQAGRIEFSEKGGRINTDFIDNSAGVDCSDKEVNIKIPLNREMRDGRLSFEKRNALLAKMTDEVADMVLEDNRLQTLALSIAESGGTRALSEFVRTIELLEQAGRIDRKVEGLLSSEDLLRRGQEKKGLTRPELAVVLSMSKLALQDAAEDLSLADDKMVGPELYEAFPKPMRKPHAEAIRAHRLRNEILATRVANRLVNRLGPSVALDMTEEEGASLASVVTSFLVVERLLDLPKLWQEIEQTPLPEMVRVELFAIAANSVRAHLSDILRATGGETSPYTLCKMLESGVRKVSTAAGKLIRAEVRNEAAARRERLISLGASEDIVRGLVRLFELDGVFGIAALASRKKMDELALARAYTKLGEALGIDWAQQQLARFVPADQWERLLTAGLARDFEQLRIDFLARIRGKDPDAAVEDWIASHRPRLEQFRNLIDRARNEGAVSVPMLAQIAAQARILLAR